MVEKNEVPNPIQIRMKQDTYDMISEGESIGAVISAISQLQKEVRASNKLTERERTNQAKWQTENIRYAKGLEAVLKDSKFTSYSGSYRFFNEYAQKLEFTLGKTMGSLTGKLTDETMKKVKEAHHIMDAMVRATKGLNKSERTDPKKQHIRDRYEFKREHLRALSKAKGSELDKLYHDIHWDKVATSDQIQTNRDIALVWKELLGIKPPREGGEARQKTLAEMYMGIGDGGSWVPGIEEPDWIPPVPPKLPEEVEEVRDSFISLEEIMSKITITSDDLLNAITKLLRKDMLKDMVEAHPIIMEYREREHKEKEKERLAKTKRAGEHKQMLDFQKRLDKWGTVFLKDEAVREKEEERLAKTKRAGEHAQLMDYRDKLDQWGNDFLKTDDEQKKIEAKRSKTLRESIASAALIVGKSFLEIFDKFFNRSATDVAKSITTFLDDPLSSMMDHTEYAVNSLSGIFKKGGYAMAGVGMGAAALGEASGMKTLAGMGKTLGVIGAVIGVGMTVLQGAINAGLGVIKAIYSKLKESSPILKGYAKMFQTAVNLIFMPIGNLMGSFFMMFGMRMINFAVWFNREFPKYQYSILSFMSGGLATIISMFANLSGLFSAGLRVLAYILDPLPGFSGAAFAIRGVADMIDASKVPLHELASKMFDVSTSSANLHNAISQNSEYIADFKTQLEEDMNGLTVSMDNLTTAMMVAIDEILSQEPELGWYDNLKKKGGGSFWKGWQTTQEEKGGGSFWKGFLKSYQDVGSKLDPMYHSRKGIDTSIGGPTGGDVLDFLSNIGELWRKTRFSGRAHGGYIPPKPGGTVVRVAEGTRGEWITPVGMGVSREGGVNIIIEIKGNIYGDEALKRTIERSVNDALMRSNVL